MNKIIAPDSLCHLQLINTLGGYIHKGLCTTLHATVACNVAQLFGKKITCNIAQSVEKQIGIGNRISPEW